MPAWCGPSTEPRRQCLRVGVGLLLCLAWRFGGAQGQDLTPPPLELNTASRAELESLPGLGPSLAGQLIEMRAQSTFRDWQDLALRVRGMGPKLQARLSGAGLRINGLPLPGTHPQPPAPVTSIPAAIPAASAPGAPKPATPKPATPTPVTSAPGPRY